MRRLRAPFSFATLSGHTKFAPAGVAKTFIPTKEAEQKNAYDEWLARIVCFAFSISPQALIVQVNRGAPNTIQVMT